MMMIMAMTMTWEARVRRAILCQDDDDDDDDGDDDDVGQAGNALL